MTEAWGPALDALEEWLRRTRDLLVAGEPAPPVTTLPAGAVPAHERLRAQVLLQQLAALEADASAQRTRLHRSYTYRR